MISSYLAYAALATLVVVSPGPATFLLLSNTPARGRRVGLLNMAGIVAAVLCHATLSLLGVSAIVFASVAAFTALKFVAAAYLAYLGLKAAVEAWRGADYSARLAQIAGSKTMPWWGAFAEGWLTNILNPKPSLFYLAVFPQFIDPTGNVLAQGAALAALHAGISATWFTLVVVSIDRIRQLLHRPMVWRGIRGLTGAVLIGLAAQLANFRLAR